MRLTLKEALARIPAGAEIPYATVLERDAFSAEVYAPRGVDAQQPHTRDELYFVVSGSGSFVDGAERYPFGPGDLLFVPANVPHRFEEFTDDLVVWAVFFGREGA